MINLESDYRSDRSNLVKDFYVPVLGASTHYDRAVGYFSASVLAVLGQGLDDFASRGGQLRIVASPRLNREDIDQIQAGYALRGVLERAALRNIEDACHDPFAAQGLGQLGILVAEGRLDIKLAYISADNRIGMYHEKIGVFRDGRDVVAFKGSANETLPGLAGNFESIEVFRSWHPGDSERAVRISRDFEDLWRDQTPLLRVIDFADAARPLIEKYARGTKGQAIPQMPPDGATITLPWPDADGILTIPTDLQVREYQKEAVRRWFANGLRGILRMATGTGKTLTALSAAAQLAKRLKRQADLPLLTVIVVPYQHLVDQWAQDVERFGITAIRAYESTDVWYRRASYLLDALTLGTARGGAIVTTNATFGKGILQPLLPATAGTS
ncbi:DEAD/DEAH box helicase family protein [Streptomyces sp. DSM 44915]|uniref:DEAD/DEAH box helicase family protein n=1 Tax=Streptomyces chisholmiae TaxID=3075540 RepID=A0ABU2K0Z7_9ACTN|nr:DEAD/DEAH box helicase family protein [Streptomyces sp. DSM 44915]MDT0270875.1 DEAD/DEAH box helicase family protein [Streptomyces sp. DSM 44915]